MLGLNEGYRQNNRDAEHADELRGWRSHCAVLRHSEREVLDDVVHALEALHLFIVGVRDLDNVLCFIALLHPHEERAHILLGARHDASQLARNELQKPHNGRSNDERHQGQHDVVPDEHKGERYNLEGVADHNNRRFRGVGERDVRLVHELRRNDARRIPLVRFRRPVEDVVEELLSQRNEHRLRGLREQIVRHEHPAPVKERDQNEPYRRRNDDPGRLLVEADVCELAEQ